MFVVSVKGSLVEKVSSFQCESIRDVSGVKVAFLMLKGCCWALSIKCAQKSFGKKS